jgi:hypothetical protein
VPVVKISATGRMLGDSPVFDNLTETPGWQECGEPAVAVYDYRCTEGHPVKRRATCAAHEPAEGDVGCRECWDAGTERPLTFARVP